MLNKVNDMGHMAAAATSAAMHVRTKKAAKIRAGIMGTLFAGVFVVSTTEMAMATAGTGQGQSLQQYSQTVSTNTNIIVDIISYICYIGGAALAALGVVGLKKHVENPSQEPLKNGIAKLGFGGILLAFPFISGVMQETMEDGGAAQFRTFGTKPVIN